jgi:hypothetical protein
MSRCASDDCPILFYKCTEKPEAGTRPERLLYQDVIVVYIAIVLASRTGRSGCWPKSSFCSLNWTKLLLFAEADPWTRERDGRRVRVMERRPAGCSWSWLCPHWLQGGNQWYLGHVLPAKWSDSIDPV